MGRLGGLLLSIVLLLTPVSGFAHPGNTASDGCHYCRTNCAKWGEVYGERHCHGGTTSSITASTTATKSSNSWGKWLVAGGVIGSGVYYLYKKGRTKDKYRAPVSTSTGVQCNKCGANMVIRNGKYGTFYGCSRYPHCRGTKSVPLKNTSSDSNQNNQKS